MTVTPHLEGRMLPSVLAIRDVYDVERLCHVITDTACRQRGRTLEPADREEAVAFLLAESVVLERTYDHRREATGATFKGFLVQRLRWRIADHLEGPYGTRREQRIGHGPLADIYNRGESSPDGDPLELALARDARGGDDSWSEALGGVHAQRDRAVVRALAGNRLGKAGPAPPGARAGRRPRVAA